MAPIDHLEDFFATFRQHVIGHGQVFSSPFGVKDIIYADWTASGRAYGPIEQFMQKRILPFVANTHTETTVTGARMSSAYEEAKAIIKKHVNAGGDDVLIFCGSGMTAAVNKLQRMLGMRIPERMKEFVAMGDLLFDETLRPVVFVTEMEHHSNHISWLETIATVEIIRCDDGGHVDLAHFGCLLERFSDRKNKIAAVTACSNVTGIRTPYHEIAKMIHSYDGLCFVDFACSAPYMEIDMHPGGGDGKFSGGGYLDAIYFSPHKFLGGPGTPGVLVFNSGIHKNTIPDQPGGGTVSYTNPWGEHDYVTDIEQREDGGTPPFLQGIKAAMCIRLKEAMGVKNMLRREEEILKMVFDRFSRMEAVRVLAGEVRERLGVVSFVVQGAHHGLIVKILNDRFGVQTRGGCSCAGTYGHMLLDVDMARSHEILQSIRSGDLSGKPGWVRLSIHPTMSDREVGLIMDAIGLTVRHFEEWGQDYRYDQAHNEYFYKGEHRGQQGGTEGWFEVATW